MFYNIHIPSLFLCLKDVSQDKILRRDRMLLSIKSNSYVLDFWICQTLLTKLGRSGRLHRLLKYNIEDNFCSVTQYNGYRHFW